MDKYNAFTKAAFFLSILFTGVSLLPVITNAQTIQWQKPLGGTQSEFSNSIELTRDGGYIVCGVTASADGDVTGFHAAQDLWVVKLSSTGTVQWQKTFGSAAVDYGMSVKPLADSGYIITGYTNSAHGDVAHPHGGFDCWLIRINDNGDMLWEKTYGGTGNDFGTDVRQTFDGGFIISGNTNSTDGDVTGYRGGVGQDCWVIKVNDTGAIQWQKTFGGTNDEGAVSIIQTKDSGYIFTGFTMSHDGDITNYHGGTGEGGDVWVVKLNSTGELVWQKTYGGSQEEQGFSILQTTDGNYVVGASTQSANGDITDHIGQADGWLLKLDDIGRIIWQKSYGLPTADYITCVRQAPDKGFVFAGWNGNAWLAHTDSVGTLLWQKSYGGSRIDEAWSMQLTGDGGYVMTGVTNSANGDVSGYHAGADSLTDIWVLKVADPLAVTPVSVKRSHPAVYPNPTDEILMIEGIETSSKATLYNILGQAVASWQLSAGKTQVSLANIAPGSLLLLLSDANGQQENFKITKLK